jgi:aconitate hydratase
VIAKSFARIHRANLINWGIVPLEFDDPTDYEGIRRDDTLRIDGLRDALHAGRKITVTNERAGTSFQTRCGLTPRERDILLAGGLLAQTASSISSPRRGEHPVPSPPPEERAG